MLMTKLGILFISQRSR